MAMMVGVGGNAQQRKQHREPLKPEQRAELQSKKMTLALDLNEKQQKDVQKLLADQGKKRETLRNEYRAKKQEGKKLSTDERFALKSKMLDDRIAMRTEMKKILTPEQFNKLESTRSKMHHALRKKYKKHENHNRR